MSRICLWRSCSNEVTGRKNKLFCSRKCGLKDKVTKARANYKKRAVEFLGGKCIKCGYNKNIRALQFHHVDPFQKSFGIAESGCTRSWERVKEELLKCSLLCSNCHAEEEDIQLGIRLMARLSAVTGTDVGSSPMSPAFEISTAHIAS